MKTTSYFLLLLVALLVCALPSNRLQSQALPPPADPLTAIQALQTANDDLIKRQEATLKDLSDMTDAAREAKIFARRG